MVKAYKVEVLVLGLNDDADLEVGDSMPRLEFATVMSVEEREVEWSDDHPLNKLDTQLQAYADLFAPKTPCDRYWREGAYLTERGLLYPHRASCADCQRSYENHRRLAAMLTQVGKDYSSKPGWQGRVWNEVSRGEGSGDVSRRGSVRKLLQACVRAGQGLARRLRGRA